MFQPAGRLSQRPCRQQGLFFRRAGIPPMQTTPTPVLSSPHQIGSESIVFQITAVCMEMAIVLNRIRFVSRLIEMISPRRLAMSMPTLGVRQPVNNP